MIGTDFLRKSYTGFQKHSAQVLENFPQENFHEWDGSPPEKLCGISKTLRSSFRNFPQENFYEWDGSPPEKVYGIPTQSSASSFFR